MEETLEIEIETNQAGESIEKIMEDIYAICRELKAFAQQITQMFAVVAKGFKSAGFYAQKLSQKLKECAQSASLLGSTLSGVGKETDLQDILPEDASGDWLADLANVATILGTIVSMVIAFVTNGEAVGAAMSGILSATGGTIQTVLLPVISTVASVITKIPGWVGIVAAAIAAVITLVVVFWDEISAFLSGAWDAIASAAASVAAWFYEQVIAPLGQLISTLLTSIGTWITEAWNAIAETLSTVATWFNDNIIQPIISLLEPAIEWFSQLFQGVWQLIKDICYNIVSYIQGSVQIVFAILLTIGTWIYLNVIQPVASFFADLWNGIKEWAIDAWNGIVAVFVSVATWFNQNVIQPVAGFFSGLWSGICGFAKDAWDGIVAVFKGVAAWFDEHVVQPVVKIVDKIADGFKSMVNGVIGFINGMIAGIISGINGVIRVLNNLQFTVPDWVPGLGGSTLGFNLKTLTAPQIPYLAKGAVLPANKPFMAVVGDQRHGTNVEAPLATIQEAVGLVMEDHISAMMAGFQALLDEQRAIRHTIEGIEIGDDVIGEAALRYNRKMAVVWGA